jgi:ribose transport system substrate-binding protein
MALALIVPATVLAQSPAPFVPSRQTGIPGALTPSELKLWTYDFDTGKYVEAPGDGSQTYVPNTDRQFPAETTIGYLEGWAANTFSVSIHDRLYELADQMGAKVAQCDANFDPPTAVTCSEQIVQQHPAFVVNSNWRAEAAATTMANFDAAKIPAVSDDVVHPNAIFFGSDSYVSGEIAGKAAATYAQGLGHCADAWVLEGINPGEGDAANQRLAGFSDGVQEVCGALPTEHIVQLLFDQGTPDQALTKTTDWLTANPDVPYVLASSIDDERVTGMTKALAQSDRAGVGAGQGCDDVGIAATKESTVEDTRFLGCVAFFPERYPDYLMSIAYDVLAGTPVPQEVHIEHQFLDRSNIASVYP